MKDVRDVTVLESNSIGGIRRLDQMHLRPLGSRAGAFCSSYRSIILIIRRRKSDS